MKHPRTHKLPRLVTPRPHPDRRVRLLKPVWRLIIAVIGGTTLVLGIILLPLPGPGLLVILAGLAILSLEFNWAARLVNRVRNAMKKARSRRKKRQSRPPV